MRSTRALDYLVRPFDDERFEMALRRVRRRVELESLGGRASNCCRCSKARLHVAVQSRGKMRVVPVGDIEYITAGRPLC